MGGTGRHRKPDKGQSKGGAQADHWRPCSLPQSREGSLLNFRLEVNTHREAGKLLGQVHNRQRAPTADTGTGCGASMTKAPVLGLDPPSLGRALSPPAVTCGSCCRLQSSAHRFSNTKKFAQTSSDNNLRPSPARQKHRNQCSTAMQNPALQQLLSQGYKEATQQRKSKGL